MGFHGNKKKKRVAKPKTNLEINTNEKENTIQKVMREDEDVMKTHSPAVAITYLERMIEKHDNNDSDTSSDDSSKRNDLPKNDSIQDRLSTVNSDTPVELFSTITTATPVQTENNFLKQKYIEHCKKMG